jgi:hypothetical protein
VEQDLITLPEQLSLPPVFFLGGGTIVQWSKEKGQKETLNRKRTMEQNDTPPPKKNPEVNSVAPEGLSY